MSAADACTFLVAALGLGLGIGVFVNVILRSIDS